MVTRVGHVHIRYRVRNGSSSAALAVPVLTRVARERLHKVCDQYFSETFEQDPTVYVIRNVTTRVAVVASSINLESQLAERWGQRLCASVVRAVAARNDDGNLVRFENQAEFVAQFLSDLSKETAWEKWYYGAFRTYRQFSKRDAVVAICRDNQEWVWDIMCRLRRLRRFEPILLLLGHDGQHDLWQLCGGRDRQEPSTDQFRLFVRTACALLDAMTWWKGTSPPEEALLEAYVRTQPPVPQWSTAETLADAVADVVRWLVRQDVVRANIIMDTEERALMIREASAHCEWLDGERLVHMVGEIVEFTALASSSKSLMQRPPNLTPAQSALLQQLIGLLRAGECRIDVDHSATYGNLLRVVAALLERGSSVSRELVVGFVESVFAVCKAVGASGRVQDVMSQLRRGQTQALLNAESVQDREALERHLSRVMHAGASAWAVVEELVTQSEPHPGTGGMTITSRCAGLFILIRAVQDIRLASVLKDCGFQRIQPVLLGLAHRFAGVESVAEGTWDPGVLLWAGVEGSDPSDVFEELSALDLDRFDQALKNQVEAQGLSHDDDEPIGISPESDAVTGSEALDKLLDQAAGWTLRAWARWLPGLSGSSAPYLLRHFIRRPGTITLGNSCLHVWLEPAGLDEILRMAGYLKEAPAVSWLGNRTVRFTIGH